MLIIAVLEVPPRVTDARVTRRTVAALVTHARQHELVILYSGWDDLGPLRLLSQLSQALPRFDVVLVSGAREATVSRLVADGAVVICAVARRYGDADVVAAMAGGLRADAVVRLGSAGVLGPRRSEVVTRVRGRGRPVGRMTCARMVSRGNE